MHIALLLAMLDELDVWTAPVAVQKGLRTRRSP